MSTTWGAPIAKGSDVWPGPGKPVWLGDLERCAFKLAGGWHGGDGSCPSVWGALDHTPAIKLPAGHPAYTVIAWNEAHPGQPPFFPWGGGDDAPEDWDGEQVIDRSGVVRGAHKAMWRVGWAHDPSPKPGDAVGYRQRATPASTPAPLDEAAQAAIALESALAKSEAAQLNLYRQAEHDREARRKAEEAFDLIAPFVAKFAAAASHYDGGRPQFEGSTKFVHEPDPSSHYALAPTVTGRGGPGSPRSPTIGDLRMLAAAYVEATALRRGIEIGERKA